MTIALRIVGLLVVMVAAFTASAYASQFTAAVIFPAPSYPRPYSEMIVAAVAGSLAAGLVAAIPLAWLFDRRAWLGALVVAAPVLALRLPELASYTGPQAPQVKIMAGVEALLYVLCVVGAAVISYRLTARSNFSLQAMRSRYARPPA